MAARASSWPRVLGVLRMLTKEMEAAVERRARLSASRVRGRPEEVLASRCGGTGLQIFWYSVTRPWRMRKKRGNLGEARVMAVYPAVGIRTVCGYGLD
jgi:hypothetical protein